MNVRIAKVEDAKVLLNIYEYYVTNTLLLLNMTYLQLKNLKIELKLP